MLKQGTVTCIKFFFVAALLSNAEIANTEEASPKMVPCEAYGRIRDCITVPLATPSSEATAKAFQPPVDDKAVIYIARPYTHKRMQVSNVFVDGKLVGRLAPETFAAVKVTPGTHTIKVTGGTDESPEFSLLTSPGELYYLQYSIGQLFNRYSGKLKLVDEDRARQQLSDLRMVHGYDTEQNE